MAQVYWSGFRRAVWASLLTFGGMCGAVSAAIIPVWRTEDALTVEVDRGQAAHLTAAGFVDVGTLDVLLAYDVSGSMAFATGQEAPNGGEQRGDWGEAGAMAFVDALPDAARLGLIRFKGNVAESVPLGVLGPPASAQRIRLNTAIDGMARDGTDGTNIGLAIDKAAEILNAPEVNSDSKHIVVLTDGEENRGDAVAATRAAVAAGIHSVSTVGLPGADVSLLDRIATIGNGRFVDATSLTNLIEDFGRILDGVERLDRLEIFADDGRLLGNPTVNGAGEFTVPLEIHEGENEFIARVTSTLGNVREASLVIHGVVVPEPLGGTMMLSGWLALLRRRRRGGHSARR